MWKFINTGRKIPFHTAAGLMSRAGQLKHCNGRNIYEKYIAPITEKRLKTIISLHSERQAEGRMP